MTKEQAAVDTWDLDYQIGVMQAFKARRQIEFRFRDMGGDVWELVDDPKWDWHDCEYRIKPTATLRPWTADEVPLGAFIRSKEHGWKSLILEITSDGFIVINKSRARIAINDGFSPEFALQQFEHSLDGKTWLPCGVEEESK